MGKEGIFVMGSYAVGMTAQCENFPSRGQTVKGTGFSTIHGGKGSNQAIAAARLGGAVQFCSCIGDDTFGKLAKELYVQERIDSSLVKVSKEAETGVGVVLLDQEGNNEIVIVLGANEKFSIGDTEKIYHQIASSKVFLAQLEFNLDAVKKAIEIATENEVIVILNPAPYCDIDKEIIRKVSIITPNETEAAQLVGAPFNTPVDQLAKKIFQEFGCKVLITTGHNGCYLKTETEEKAIATYPLKPIDTTGAGDTFSGALAFGLSEGKSLEEAIDIALAASSLSVTKFGVVSSIPYYDEVIKLMEKGKIE